MLDEDSPWVHVDTSGKGVQGREVATLQLHQGLHRRKSRVLGLCPRAEEARQGRVAPKSQRLLKQKMKLPPHPSPSLLHCPEPVQEDQIFIASLELNNTSM